jgi:hypothetical protein
MIRTEIKISRPITAIRPNLTPNSSAIEFGKIESDSTQ